MFRIWAKVYKNDRIAQQTVYEPDEAFTYSEFFRYLTDICGMLDLPTPVLMKVHLFHYAKYKQAVFRPSDFVEQVSFDKLVLENIG